MFYQKFTPKLQTDLIQTTQVLKEFEKNFSHFFEDCERGFINELIISMYCRFYTPGTAVISYKTQVKEIYFIRQGQIEIFNNENDEIIKDKPILYLPQYSYFGDYHIFMGLKSNLVFKTVAQSRGYDEPLPDVILMCVTKELFLNTCHYFS